MTRKPGLDEIGTARVAQEVNLTVETSGMTHDRFPLSSGGTDVPGMDICATLMPCLHFRSIASARQPSLSACSANCGHIALLAGRRSSLRSRLSQVFSRCSSDAERDF